MKITITKKQFEQFNKMLGALRIIAHDYKSSEQILHSKIGDFGLPREEELEYAYDNIQHLAKITSRGCRPLRLPAKS